MAGEDGNDGAALVKIRDGWDRRRRGSKGIAQDQPQEWEIKRLACLSQAVEKLKKLAGWLLRANITYYNV